MILVCPIMQDCFVSKTTSIAVESLHFNHIWIVRFEIQCGGVQKQNYKKQKEKKSL